MNRQIVAIGMILQLVLIAFGSRIVSAQDARTHELNPLTKDGLIQKLRENGVDNYVVSGVIDISYLNGNEVWSGGTFEFKEGASIKIGTISFRLNADEILAPEGAVIVYTFDDEEFPSKPGRSRNGNNAVTPSGAGRRGSNGSLGQDGIEGTAGLSSNLLVISVRNPLSGVIKVSLHGQNGGDGGDGGDGGNGDDGNRGRRASDGPFSCRRGGGDGGKGGNGGRGGNAGIGGKAGDGGKLVKMVQNLESILLIGGAAKRGEPGRPGSGGDRGSGGGGGRGSTYCGGGSGGSRGSPGANGIVPEPRYNEIGSLPAVF